MTCPYCDSPCEVKDSAVVYGASYGNVLICTRYPDCDSYVGCHAGTDRPKGSLANAELREARKAVHRVFDPLWKPGRTKRSKHRNHWYGWLANRMKLTRDECHVGMFDLKQCQQAIEICQQKAAIR